MSLSLYLIVIRVFPDVHISTRKSPWNSYYKKPPCVYVRMFPSIDTSKEHSLTSTYNHVDSPRIFVEYGNTSKIHAWKRACYRIVTCVHVSFQRFTNSLFLACSTREWVVQFTHNVQIPEREHHQFPAIKF